MPGGGGGPGGPRDRSANFGPPAPPRRLRGKKGQQQEYKPRGPIKERTGGRIYAVDDLEGDDAVEVENLATKAPEDADAETATTADIDTATTAEDDDDQT
jgi:hypothetical protein